MKKNILILLILLSGYGFTRCNAQTVPDRTIVFSVSDSGEYTPVTWGLDLAWLSEGNIRRGIAFMGIERVDVIRSSFTPTAPLIDGELPDHELGILNERLNIISLLRPNTVVALNCDHPSVDPWYEGNAERWAQLIDVTTRHHQEAGRTVVSVAPFNEPDYGWGQGDIHDFYAIAGELKNNPRFDNIRISGGNTLNTDQALYWYSALQDRLDEGNTHQLAGSFDNYASFYETVRAKGHHATNDELHNVIEAMVGVEYGLQTGIWWGTAEFARGEFVKASDGRRLGYAEHRPNWTAASVYRNPDGKVQAFIGSSERQAVTTSYRFVSKDRDVYYDGYGPKREYTLVIPGGTGYQQGQTNAERVLNITWGDDIQPPVNGCYVLVNRNSGKVMEVTGGSLNAGANVRQNLNTGTTYQQWDVIPVDSRIGGDYSYFTITAVHSGKALDVYNWSLDNGGNLVVWDDTKGANQQWYLEYAEDGWFYIRSRHSAKCLDVYNASIANAANIVQWEKNGSSNQQWRFLPVNVPVEFGPPDPPVDLIATPNAESVHLEWTASPDNDVAGYTIFRSDSADRPYNTIARNVAPTSFVDNTTTTDGQYFYSVKAVDSSLNQSAYSNEASATVTGYKEMIAHFAFEGNTLDSSLNLNNSTPFGELFFVDGRVGDSAIALNGTDTYLQLPATVANQQEMTIATWVYWNGGASWQRIFDFGNGLEEYMYLSPRMRFTMKYGGPEERLDAAELPVGEWTHVAVALGNSKTCIYINGELEAESDAFTINPLDLKPIFNYIGRSQNLLPIFNGYLDDFMMYNFALSASEITELYTTGSITSNTEGTKYHSASNLRLWPVPANDLLHVKYDTGNNTDLLILNIYDMHGRLIVSKELHYTPQIKLDVSEYSPGIYMVVLTTGERSIMEKFIINH